MNSPDSIPFLRRVFHTLETPRIISLDLETLIEKNDDFLNDERIIAVSLSYGSTPVKTKVFVADDDSKSSELKILRDMDKFLGEYQPNVIIGYNHSGYDIPLIQSKLRKLSYSDQLWNFKYYAGTAIVTDMMYIIAEDLEAVEDYRIRKLRDVVVHPRYSGLELRRKKDHVILEGMTVGQAIKHLWLQDRAKFLEYCEGDTEDVLKIFYHIFFNL
jgi:DNA polymerase elongation subunit (family B)